MASPLLTPAELAERWGISVRTLDNWRWKGTGPRFHKIGRKVMYKLELIEAYEDEQERQTTASDRKASAESHGC